MTRFDVLVGCTDHEIARARLAGTFSTFDAQNNAERGLPFVTNFHKTRAWVDPRLEIAPRSVRFTSIPVLVHQTEIPLPVRALRFREAPGVLAPDGLEIFRSNLLRVVAPVSHHIRRNRHASALRFRTAVAIAVLRVRRLQLRPNESGLVRHRHQFQRRGVKSWDRGT